MENPMVGDSKVRAKALRVGSFVVSLLLSLSGGLHSAQAQATLVDGLGGPAGFGADDLGVVDDASSTAISVSSAFPNGLNFFGTTYTDIYVNSNGNITFGAGDDSFTSTPFPSASVPMIAAWWTNLDCNPDLAPNNRVYWDLQPGQFVATWYDVGYFSENHSASVTVQIILRDASSAAGGLPGDFDVEIRYGDLALAIDDGTGENFVVNAGFDAGNGTDFAALSGSSTDAVLDLSTGSNGGTAGVWRLLVRDGVVPVCGDDTIDAGEACDDGNTTAGDGCSAVCTVECADDDHDGVCNDVDQCQGADVSGDTDGDGVCNDSDVCMGNDQSGDTDNDGVCNDSDVCSGNDQSGDTDNDGVCDDSDTCSGNDASGDTDGDGVCNDSDQCQGDDETGDTDEDGVCDDTDLCEGNDATGDADHDGVCDGTDLCFGNNASGDSDGDGVCNSDDVCTGDDESGDSDADGVCNDLDQCAGNDQSGDTDHDGTCDNADPCPLDPLNDSDGDLICDSADLCRGNDASGDDDHDGACNDIDKEPVLVETSEFSGQGGTCQYGGVRIDVGTDENSDGTLAIGEITRTSYVCNGAPGSAGGNGSGNLISASDEGSGNNCAAGGVRIDIGVDDGSDGGTPDNGELEAGEVRSTRYVCNGEGGADGPDGQNGANGTNGTNGQDGVDGEDGANGTNGTNGTDGEDGQDGADGSDGKVGRDGQDGSNGHDALSRVTVVAKGDSECPNGGFRVELGRDLDDDGKLTDDEVEHDDMLCNGSSGSSAVIETDPIEEGDEECPDGGLHIRLGLDDGGKGATAGNGKLEAAEVDDEQHVCLSPADVVVGGGGGAGGCSAVASGTRSTGAGIGLLLIAGVLLRRRRRVSNRHLAS